HAIFFGASGLTFCNGFRIAYNYADECPTQLIYATRPSNMRVLMADHTKLGITSGATIQVTIASMLEHCNLVIIVSDFDLAQAPPEQRALIEREARGLHSLLEPLKNNTQFESKNFIFRLVDLEGAVVRE